MNDFWPQCDFLRIQAQRRHQRRHFCSHIRSETGCLVKCSASVSRASPTKIRRSISSARSSRAWLPIRPFLIFFAIAPLAATAFLSRCLAPLAAVVARVSGAAKARRVAGRFAALRATAPLAAAGSAPHRIFRATERGFAVKDRRATGCCLLALERSRCKAIVLN